MNGNTIRIEKKIITQLERCYSLAKLTCRGERKYLVASEKRFPCLLLGQDGTVEDTVWQEPGGVMTLEPLNDGSLTFLATHKFYSPNDSAEAMLVAASHTADEGWQIKKLCDLPFVHRFGLFSRGSRRYVIACTLKSAHAFKEDWTCPGRIWTGELVTDENGELSIPELKALCSGLLKNHGFFKAGNDYALVGAENGVYKVTPPAADGDWKCEQLMDIPVSDMAEGDFDGDGVKELMVFAPFHGNTLSVYKPQENGYREVYRHDGPLPFLHAIGVTRFDGRDVAIAGNREGDRELIMLSCDGNGYRETVIDRGAGPANILCDEADGCLRILAANREISEVAMYTLRA